MQDYWSTFIPYIIAILIALAVVWGLLRRAKKDTDKKRKKYELD